MDKLALRCRLALRNAIIRSPARSANAILRFAQISFFISQLTCSDVRQPTFSKLIHMMWLQPHRKRWYADFLKVPRNKNEGRKLQISPNFASNGNILSAITRDVEGK